MADRDSPDTERAPKGLFPSAYMRARRPELFSDSEGRTAYQLDAPLLEYHLESLTQRNETHDFEIFYRKLCERTIAPNLRPQTGPDGGGDSKADSETFPVSDEIAEHYFEGEPNAANERWAFAFSAKEDWKRKARDDVQGLIETGRHYDRIIFVTSRFAKAKDRAALEDDLSKSAGIPVTIHDRSWIVDQVIAHERKDIAFNYLGVGTEVKDDGAVGPSDYSRRQQLDDIERELDDRDAYRGIDQHRIPDALLAAKLARGLELPRVDIDGRFARAIRLADRYGTLHQRIETRYEQVWTAFWWFDDFDFLEARYGEIETLEAEADHARTLGYLVNLNQLLVNGVMHGHFDRTACGLDDRMARIAQLLSPMAQNEDRPNNRLEAAASLLHLDMNRALLDEDDDALSRVWTGYSDLLDQADGMGEFDAERVVKLIEALEGAGQDDPAYASLIDKLADFVAARTGEAQGALVLLRRAEKLDLTRHFEMIRLLSKAAVQLTKKEHSVELAEALGLLTIAYRSAGLLWAARATAVFTLSTMIIDVEEGGRLPPRFAVIAKIWTWLALDLQHYPDFVAAITMARGATEALAFTDEQRDKFRRDTQDQEMVAASRLLNLSNSDLAAFADWPDIFETNLLMMPRTALLYTLGYEDELRADGSIPEHESDEDARELIAMLASQPAGQPKAGTVPVANAISRPQVLTTRLIGMHLDVRTSGTDHGLLVGEVVVGSLEAFFATSIEKRIMPHTERFAIDVVETEGVDEPRFTVDLDTMSGTLDWPISLSPTRIADQEIIRSLWIDVAAQLLGAAFFIPDAEQTITEMTQGERVFARMMLVTTAANSYHRMLSRYLTRPEDLSDGDLQSYPPRSPRPVIEKIDLVGIAAQQRGVARETLEEREPAGDSHREIGVRSVIDVHLWDRARWFGFGWIENEPGFPPFVALIFRNAEAAAKIFERWRETIAPYDEQDRIRLSIIRELPDRDPHHYSVQISANAMPGDFEHGQQIGFMSRSLVVHANSSENLEGLLERHARFGAYYLIPAIWREDMGEPEFLEHLQVLKRQLNIYRAAEVTEADIERVAVEQSQDEDEE